MDVQADLGLVRSIGWFAVLLAGVLLLVWLWLRPGGGLSAVAGLMLLAVAGVCFSYRHVVHIDVQADMVEQSRRFLLWERHRGYLFSDFRAVGVGAVLGGDLRPVYLAHVVELRGRSRLVLPGIYYGLERARTEADELARELGLPVESRVRTILWS
ncbi:hypothetical protein [Desulfonatronum thioautotrophicum]|uniref:hypothetical protein n=1 Tax=Desulfonatronum thioautotrophicum TaxID=617001 RepID=UPI0005EB8EE7|nr:hypothetical protein [Desulfonatronum thioautotrophicum]